MSDLGRLRERLVAERESHKRAVRRFAPSGGADYLIAVGAVDALDDAVEHIDIILKEGTS